MKKIFLMIAFMFSVVCYAAPPHDFPGRYPDQGQCLYQDQRVLVSSAAVQEVAFNYLGDNLILNCVTRQGKRINDAKLQGIDEQRSITGYSLKKLSKLNSNSGVINLNVTVYSINKQHSNYGYPFGADYNS